MANKRTKEDIKILIAYVDSIMTTIIYDFCDSLSDEAKKVINQYSTQEELEEVTAILFCGNPIKDYNSLVDQWVQTMKGAASLTTYEGVIMRLGGDWIRITTILRKLGFTADAVADYPAADRNDKHLLLDYTCALGESLRNFKQSVNSSVAQITDEQAEEIVESIKS